MQTVIVPVKLYGNENWTVIETRNRIEKVLILLKFGFGKLPEKTVDNQENKQMGHQAHQAHQVQITRFKLPWFVLIMQTSSSLEKSIVLRKVKEKPTQRSGSGYEDSGSWKLEKKSDQY